MNNIFLKKIAIFKHFLEDMFNVLQIIFSIITRKSFIIDYMANYLHKNKPSMRTPLTITNTELKFNSLKNLHQNTKMVIL